MYDLVEEIQLINKIYDLENQTLQSTVNYIYYNYFMCPILLFKYLWNIKSNNTLGNESDRKYLNVMSIPRIIYRLVKSKRKYQRVKKQRLD